MQRRCDRNRKRSKRRAIFCPIHDCYLDSVSRKYNLYADQASHLRQRGMGKRSALMLMSTHTTVPIQGEWLEAFWCGDCQQKNWYHVCKTERTYQISLAQDRLWQQVSGVLHPDGNPSVSEFTLRQSRAHRSTKIKDFGFVYSS